MSILVCHAGDRGPSATGSPREHSTTLHNQHSTTYSVLKTASLHNTLLTGIQDRTPEKQSNQTKFLFGPSGADRTPEIRSRTSPTANRVSQQPGSQRRLVPICYLSFDVVVVESMMTITRHGGDLIPLNARELGIIGGFSNHVAVCMSLTRALSCLLAYVGGRISPTFFTTVCIKLTLHNSSTLEPIPLV